MKKKLINGQKIGPQFRTVQIALTGDDAQVRAEMNEGDRIIKNVSVSSDVPYDRYYGAEILVHSDAAIDLARIKKGASPLLFNHDRDALIGKVSNPQIRNGKLYVDFKFSNSEMGKQMLADLKDGILTECSIGYEVNKYEVDEDEETYTATRWTIYECSLVTIPADATVGVGRDAEDGLPVEIVKKDIDESRKNENNDSQQRETSQKRENTMEPTPAPAAPVVNEREVSEKATATERKRVSDIQELSRHFAEKGLAGRKLDTSKAAEDHIKDGKSVGEFQSFVMVNEFKEVKPLETPDSEDLNKGGKSDSGSARMEVGGERPYVVEARSLGELFVKSKEYRSKNRSEQKCVLEINGLTNFRATFSTASSITNYNGIVAIPNIYEIGVQRPVVADLIAQGVTNLSSVPFMQETSITNAATTVSETGAKPEATFALTQTNAPVQKIAVTIPVTDEAFEDVPTLESYVNNRLRWMVETTEEAQIVSGDGTPPNLRGILNTSGIQTQAKGADTALDAIRKAKNLKVRAIGFAEPSGAVVHPTDWDMLQGLKDANNQYFGGGPFTGSYGTPFQNVERIWGMPVVVTTGIAQGTMLIGAFRTDAMIFRKKGITIDSTNSHASEFANNIVRLRAEERLALAVFRPKSFCQITGL